MDQCFMLQTVSVYPRHLFKARFSGGLWLIVVCEKGDWKTRPPTLGLRSNDLQSNEDMKGANEPLSVQFLKIYSS